MSWRRFVLGCAAGLVAGSAAAWWLIRLPWVDDLLGPPTGAGPRAVPG